MENIRGLTFEMGELRNNLPKKRGLSRYYSGKARSYVCIADVKCLEDLQKPTRTFDDDHDAYKKKRNNRQLSSSSFSVNSNINFSNYPCRRVSSSNHCSSLCVGAS